MGILPRHLIHLSSRLTGIALLFLALTIASSFDSCKKNEPCTTCPPSGPDTTSHSFNFTQYTIGGSGSSSYFKDVAIISDSLAYAVGEVYLNDSTG